MKGGTGRRTLLQPVVLRWTGAILASRVVVALVVLFVLRDGDEVSRDLGYHAFMAEAPWSRIDQSWFPQYPPFLGVAEALTYEPWRTFFGFSVTTSLRLGSVVWDVLAGWLVVGTVRLIAPERVKLAALLYAFVPLTWMASAGAGQDEPIAAAFLAATLFCIAAGRVGWARGLGVVGLFTAKLLLLPVLVALAVARPAGRRLRDLAQTAVALAVCCGAMLLLYGTNGLTRQTGYKPEWVTFSVSPWGWLVGNRHVEVETAHVAGQLLAALVVAALVALALRRLPAGSSSPSLVDPSSSESAGSSSSVSSISSALSGSVDPVVATHMTAALFLGSFAVLTVVNPEYMAILGPPLVIVALSWRDGAWITGLACLPWLTDGAFAIIRRGPEQDSWPLFGPVYWDADGGSTGHQTLVKLHLFFSVTSSVAMIAAALILVRRITRSATTPAAAADTTAEDTPSPSPPPSATPPNPELEPATN